MRDLLVLGEDGYGKRVPIAKLRSQQRGGMGVMTTTNPPLAAAFMVAPGDELIISTYKGTVIRLAVAAIPLMGRKTRGVRVVRLRKGDRVTTATRLAAGL